MPATAAMIFAVVATAITAVFVLVATFALSLPLPLAMAFVVLLSGTRRRSAWHGRMFRRGDDLMFHRRLSPKWGSFSAGGLRRIDRREFVFGSRRRLERSGLFRH